jgi:hypothetical protein
MDTKKITESVRRVCIVAFPGAEILDICGPLEDREPRPSEGRRDNRTGLSD